MNLMQRLDKVERLASSGKVARLLHHPFKYINTIAYTRYDYLKKENLESGNIVFIKNNK